METEIQRRLSAFSTAALLRELTRRPGWDLAWWHGRSAEHGHLELEGPDQALPADDRPYLDRALELFEGETRCSA